MFGAVTHICDGSAAAAAAAAASSAQGSNPKKSKSLHSTDDESPDRPRIDLDDSGTLLDLDGFMDRIHDKVSDVAKSAANVRLR